MKSHSPETDRNCTDEAQASRSVRRLHDLVCWTLVVAGAVTLSQTGCGKAGTNNVSKEVQAELISVTPSNGETVKLVVKVTNLSSKDMVRAKALVTILDAEGQPLGTKSTYLIQGGKGGLASGESIEEDAFVEVTDKNKATGMTFEIESIRFAE